MSGESQSWKLDTMGQALTTILQALIGLNLKKVVDRDRKSCDLAMQGPERQ